MSLLLFPVLIFTTSTHFIEKSSCLFTLLLSNWCLMISLNSSITDSIGAVYLNLPHLSAHVVNRLLRENWKPIPKFLSGKKLFKNVTLQILKFYPNKLTNKNFSPYGVMSNFLCFFVLFNTVKTQNLHCTIW